jgi:hypothetical protein
MAVMDAAMDENPPPIRFLIPAYRIGQAGMLLLFYTPRKKEEERFALSFFRRR